QYGRHTFVGPDNGLFPLAMDDEPDEAVVLDVPAFWRVPEPSATFHGRDIFAPVAAHLCAGIPLTDLGSPAGALRTLRWAQPVVTPTGMQGRVVHVDRFGNCITNIEGSLFDDARGRRSTKTYVGTAIVRGRHRTYADVPEGEALILTGSSGLVEIAINGGNAAGLFSVRKGDAVNVMFLEQPDVIR
ncbi:MAG: SAM-dependent chlorinase/fluorinase, partial [Bacteroidota bacterium]